MSDHYDDFLGSEEPDPFDYEWYGPNNEFNQSGFHGHGFDDLPEGQIPHYSPEEPEYKLEDWKRDDPDNYAKILQVLIDFCLNKNKRMLRKTGESAGVEKYLQALEVDLNCGNAKLMNAQIDGKMRTCVYEFNPYSSRYDLAEDN